jgi:hypothetical protein
MNVMLVYGNKECACFFFFFTWRVLSLVQTNEIILLLSLDLPNNSDV